MIRNFEDIDHKFLSQARDGVVLGSAFAFLKPDRLLGKEFRWLRNIFKLSPSEGAGVIVPIIGLKPVALPGVTLRNEQFPALKLRSLTSDKMLYQSDRDSAHILVWDPLHCNRQRTLIVNLSDREQQRRTVMLGAHGEGEAIFKDLGSGQYSVHFDDEDQKDQHCQFTVAEYKLVPLVANMVAQQTNSGGNLEVTIKLESFGVPVQGEVKLEVMDGPARIYSSTAKSVDGNLKSDFKLTGGGPHHIQLQLVADGSKTASVPIVGSRESERKLTLFSPLGIEINGSLLAGPDAEEMRGIFLTEGAIRSTPVSAQGVVNGKLQLAIKQKIEAFTVVVVDPHHPRPAKGAIDPQSGHPAHSDQQYVQAEKLFKADEIAQSLSIFEECSDPSEIKHPNYEYYKACCHARLGHLEKAMQCLHNAVINGWNDFDYMANDDDLKAMRALESFVTLCDGGIREQKIGNVTSGQIVAVDVFSPACIVALAGYIDGLPWEGWTCALTPAKIESAIDIEQSCTPGKEMKVAVRNVPPQAKVYCIVKDARLITSDNPASRLASTIKNYAEELGKELSVGTPTKNLFDSTAPQQYGGSPPGVGSFGGIAFAATGAWGASPAGAWGSPAPTLSSAIRAQAQPQPPQYEDEAWGAAPIRRSAAAASPSMMATGAPPTEQMMVRRGQMMDGFAEQESALRSAGTLEGAKPVAESKRQDKFTATAQPEVLFAGFVAVENGIAEQTVMLPDVFSDYLVEAFVTADGDWTFVKESFRAEKTNFVDLNLPRFATVQDQAQARVYARSQSKEVTVRLFRNDEAVTLRDDTADGGTKSSTFVALPGEYRAELVGSDGTILDCQQKTVDEPGKIKHRVKALRLLSAGEALELSPAVNEISLLPGLNESFNVVAEATADYSHCCCEQTAAKVLSACAMYLFAGGDDGRKNKAEAIIIAGIERETTMWIRGQGLRAYPGRELSPYYGPAAAKHLWHLGTLKAYGKSNKLSKQLDDAVAKGLEIAKDVSEACKMEWPPSKFQTCEDAYMLIRSEPEEAKIQSAIEFVRQYVGSIDDVTKEIATLHKQFGNYGSVQLRQQVAFAAAVLFRSNSAPDIGKAIKLADFVTKQFNQDGRLYSTVDSTAAIALLSELKRRTLGSNGKASINGLTVETADFENTEAIENIKVIEGVIALQVTSTVVEDWSKFSANAEIAVSLVKNGSTQRKLNLADSVDLVVTISGGYKEGDILWVCLPEALSRLFGGGQVKMFSLDFAGLSELRIPLAATGLTVKSDGENHPQHLAVCLRNMFEEERSANPGLIPFSVSQ